MDDRAHAYVHVRDCGLMVVVLPMHSEFRQRPILVLVAICPVCGAQFMAGIRAQRWRGEVVHAECARQELRA